MSHADLSSAKLNGADLGNAYLADADLRGAHLDSQRQLNQACGSPAQLPEGLTNTNNACLTPTTPR